MKSTAILWKMLIVETFPAVNLEANTVGTKLDRRMKGLMQSENEGWLSKDSRDSGWVD